VFHRTIRTAAGRPIRLGRRWCRPLIRATSHSRDQSLGRRSPQSGPAHRPLAACLRQTAEQRAFLLERTVNDRAGHILLGLPHDRSGWENGPRLTPAASSLHTANPAPVRAISSSSESKPNPNHDRECDAGTIVVDFVQTGPDKLIDFGEPAAAPEAELGIEVDLRRDREEHADVQSPGE
jgi:hypothetical protein